MPCNRVQCKYKKMVFHLCLYVTKSKSGYCRMIDKPTPFVNGSSWCIGLIFSSNVTLASLTKNYKLEQSLNEKCHYNIIYGSLNLDIPLSSPYYGNDWDFKNVKTRCIQKAMSYFAFHNHDSNGKRKILTEILMNVFPNFVPHKIKKIDNRTPEWMSKSIELSLK